MSLYTRTGDKGFTQLPGPDGSGGLRLRKDDVRLAAVGGLDELNSALGLAQSEAVRVEHLGIRETLDGTQQELLAMGAVIATAMVGGPATTEVKQSWVDRMERQIDELAGQLPPLSHFIVPGGCELACRLHVARCVARRAERAVVSAVSAAGVSNQFDTPVAVMLRYLNRLSDLLFVLARKANEDAGCGDVIWKR